MSKRCKEMRFGWMKSGSLAKMVEYIKALIRIIEKDYEDLAIVCICNPSSAGDCVGPMIGSILLRWDLPGSVFVYGNMDCPISDNQLYIMKKMIETELNKPLIIAVDACLSVKEDIESVFIYEGAIRPGSALGRNLPEIGDVSISCVVNSVWTFNGYRINCVKKEFICNMV